MGLGLATEQGDELERSVKEKGRWRRWWKDGKKKEGRKRRWWNGLCLAGSCAFRSKSDGAVSSFCLKNAESKTMTKVIENQQQIIAAPDSTPCSTSETSIYTPTICQELRVASQLRRYTFSELRCATRNFRPESLLGEGGFGCVFKGWVEEHGTAPMKPGLGLTVAVKTLNHDGLQGHKEWLAEVNFLGNLIHPNLVKLIGYCIEEDQRLLVYEFMPRGSLENHLFRSELIIQFPLYFTYFK